MTRDEIVRAAWREVLISAMSSFEDWIDEEDEYGDDYQDVFAEGMDIIENLMADHEVSW